MSQPWTNRCNRMPNPGDSAVGWRLGNPGAGSWQKQERFGWILAGSVVYRKTTEVCSNLDIHDATGWCLFLSFFFLELVKVLYISQLTTL